MQPVVPRTPHTVKLFHLVPKLQEISVNDLYLEEGEELAVPLFRRNFLMNGIGV
jgi:hypothetical protein